MPFSIKTELNNTILDTILKISEQLLYNIKYQEPFTAQVEALSKLNYEDLVLALATDNHKKAFWINIYNSYYQIFDKKSEDQDVVHKTIFSQKDICIAKHNFSLDDIEHGILRKGKYIIGFGYLHHFFYPKFIKKLKVETLDFKIHFALNCGAASCPPILVYEYDKIEEQLDLATHSFIESETILDEEKKTIKTSKLFLWYLGDFGNITRVKKIIGNVFTIDVSNYKIKFLHYNWEKKTHNFE